MASENKIIQVQGWVLFVEGRPIKFKCHDVFIGDLSVPQLGVQINFPNSLVNLHTLIVISAFFDIPGVVDFWIDILVAIMSGSVMFRDTH